MSDSDWVTQAMCQGQPTRWWFPERGDKAYDVGNYKKAKAICGTCSVKKQCQEYGTITQSYGMWGGVLMGVRYHAKNTEMDLQNV